MLISNNIVVNGRRTSMRLEAFFWQSLRDICQRENVRMTDLLSYIEVIKKNAGLTTTVKMFVLVYYRWALQKYETDTFDIPEKFHPQKILEAIRY